MYNPMDLTGKKVIITGASSGIGRETAIRASRLGATVSLVARNEIALQETLAAMEPGSHACYLCDLSQTEEIEPLVKRIVAEQGPQDGFVHSAGIGNARPLKMTNPKFTEPMLRVHTFAFIEFVRCLSLRKNLNNGASLVGVSSVAAQKGAASQGAYAAAKAAMEGFIRPAAEELAPRGIRINNVAFAMVKTPMFEGFRDAAGQQEQEEMLRRHYLGIIDVEDAANMLLFMLSDAVRYITASTIPVFSGY